MRRRRGTFAYWVVIVALLLVLCLPRANKEDAPWLTEAKPRVTPTPRSSGRSSGLRWKQLAPDVQNRVEKLETMQRILLDRITALIDHTGYEVPIHRLIFSPNFNDASGDVTFEATDVTFEPNFPKNIHRRAMTVREKNGEVYEIEYNYDAMTGEHRLFRDGDLVSETSGEDMAWFRTVQHTADYTPTGLPSQDLYVPFYPHRLRPGEVGYEHMAVWHKLVDGKFVKVE